MAVTFFKTQDNLSAARVGSIVAALVCRHGEWMIRTATAQKALHEYVSADFSHTWLSGNTLSAFESQMQAYDLHLQQLTTFSRTSVPNIPSPWGPSQSAREYQQGIVSVATASHGGFLLDATCNECVDPEWRSRTGDYEEDVCWAIVAFTFPHLFTDWELSFVDRTLKEYWPEPYTRLLAERAAAGAGPAI